VAFEVLGLAARHPAKNISLGGVLGIRRAGLKGHHAIVEGRALLFNELRVLRWLKASNHVWHL